jgi:hypothetical protein
MDLAEVFLLFSLACSSRRWYFQLAKMVSPGSFGSNLIMKKDCRFSSKSFSMLMIDEMNVVQ